MTVITHNNSPMITHPDADVADTIIDASLHTHIPLIVADLNEDNILDSTINWANYAVGHMLSREQESLIGDTLSSFIETPLVGKAERVTRHSINVRSATGELSEWYVTVHITRTHLVQICFFKSQDSGRSLAEVSDSRLSIVLERSPVATILSEQGIRLAYVNDALCALFGAPSHELLGMGWISYMGDSAEKVRHLVQELYDGNNSETEVKIFNPEKGERLTRLRLTALTRPGEPASFIGTFEDITDSRKFEDTLHHQSRHDALTGLPNRILLTEVLEKHLRSADPQLAAYFVDLDRFKEINDTLGHAAGDELIFELGRRLRACVRPGDLVARWGGDEFIVLCCGIKDDQAAMVAGQRMLASALAPITIQGREVSATMSIGVVRADASSTPDSLMRDADVAMYQAKRAGKNRVSLFEIEQRTAIHEEWELVTDLRMALIAGDIEVHYQPIVPLDIEENIVDQASAEALVRWNHPVHGFISPARFCALAEANNLANELGEYVIRAVCAQMRSWFDNSPQLVPNKVSINVSPLQLRSSRLLHVFKDMLERYDLPAECISVELTETALMDNAEMAYEVLSGLRKMGITVSIDDFGTGHSSLSHLSKLPVDCIKIDKSFVDQLVSGEEVILNAVVMLAQALGLNTVAEGVEDEDTAEKLRALGCSFAQGWNYAKSMNATDFILWKRTNS